MDYRHFCRSCAVVAGARAGDCRGGGAATAVMGVLAKAIEAVLEPGIAAGITPGAAAVVGKGRELLAEVYGGQLAPGRGRVDHETVYDLSSLTKPLATLGCAISMVADGSLTLDTEPLNESGALDVGPAGDSRRTQITVELLAAHASGLPARSSYFDAIDPRALVAGGPVARERAKRQVVAMACREALVSAPGTAVLYSDIGYIVLGALLEAISGEPLDQLFSRRIAAPLGLSVAGFRPLGTIDGRGRREDTKRVAPTDHCAWRGSTICGAVQDENAFAMGGVAGHAGLFATAREVHLMVGEWVAAYDGEGGLFDSELVRRCWRGPGSIVANSTWSLGWDTPTRGASSAGRLVSGRAFGHLGFTGTSVWVDVDRGIHVVLLTNRVHPCKDDDRIRDLRPRIHDAIFTTYDKSVR